MSNALPHGWTKTSLGILCDERVTQESPAAEPVQYIDISSIDRSTKRVGETTLITSEDAPTRARQWVRKDDVLVSMTRPNLNAVAQVSAELDGAVASTGFHILRPRVLEARWIFYRVRTHEFVADVCEGLQGVVYPAVRPHDVRRHELPLPPLPEQRRIVAALESYFTRLDDAVATLERVQRNLKRYRASVLKAAVEGRLVPTEAELARAEGRGYEPASVLPKRILAERRRRWEEAELTKMTAKGKAPKDNKWKAKYVEPVAPVTRELPALPEGWCWATPDQLAAHEDYAIGIGPFGSNLKVTDYCDDGVPLIFVRNIRAESFGGDDTRYITRKKALELKAHIAKAGDVLVTKMGEPPGDAAIYPVGSPDAVMTADCIRVRLHPKLSTTRPVLFALRSSTFQEQVVRVTKGVAQKKISLERFKSLALPLAPAAEQVRFAAEADRLFSKAEAAEKAVERDLSRLDRLRQAILRWAFEGRVVDQDPADEPASALLDRIRAERATTANAPPRRVRRTKREVTNP